MLYPPPLFKSLTITLAVQAALVPMAFAQQAEKTLSEVIVRDTYEREDLPTLAPGRKAAKGARLGILGATVITDAPFHVNAYSRELAEDWGALTLQDVLENDSGVVFTTNKHHLLQNFNLRGVDVNASDIAVNGLYGVAPANSVPIELFERVEVLRGPNVLLSGMPPIANVAGTVNMVTKRALGKPIADLTFSLNSKSYLQAHVDVGRRFGDEQRLGLRFNGVYGSGKMGVEGEKQGRKVGGLAVDYLGERFRASLDVYSSENEIDNGSPGMYNFTSAAPVVAANPGLGLPALPAAPALNALPAPPRGDVNMFRGTHGRYGNTGYLARAEFDFNNNWQGYLATGGSESDGQGLLFGTRALVTNANGNARTAVFHLNYKAKRSTTEAGIIGKFDTGGIKHRVQLSFNTLEYKTGSFNNGCNYCVATNLYAGGTVPFPTAPAFTGYTTNDEEFNSVALADTMSFGADTVLLTLGARRQSAKLNAVTGNAARANSDSRLSPMAAVVVRPWGDKVSLFGNYSEGLEPGQTVTAPPAYTNVGTVFPARVSKQRELGVKLQAGEMTHTVSVYEIERPSYVTDGGAPATMIQAEQRLRGLEWSAYGKLTSTLSFLGGVTNIDSHYTAKASPALAGKDTFGTPEWRARIGLDWNTPVPGLTVGGRVIHTGAQWVNSANTLRLPSWNRLDLNAGYETRLGATPVQFNASVENLADKNYWSGTFGDGFVMPGAPRTFRLSAKVSFW